MQIILTITDKKELKTLVINLINKIITDSNNPIKADSQGRDYLMRQFRRVINEKEWNRDIHFYNNEERDSIFSIAEEVIDWATLKDRGSKKD